MIQPFKDRRDILFGRDAAIQHLCDRVQRPGITAVVGKPLMGKTWTLTEVARRLSAEGQYLVGYHESNGSEASHLLYAVSNLYARWLADSDMRGQAMAVWEQHKDGLVTRVGRFVGALFDSLGKTVAPEGITKLVSLTFD